MVPMVDRAVRAGPPARDDNGWFSRRRGVARDVLLGFGFRAEPSDNDWEDHRSPFVEELCDEGLHVGPIDRGVNFAVGECLLDLGVEVLKVNG